jgi:hypothetical protein
VCCFIEAAFVRFLDQSTFLALGLSLGLALGGQALISALGMALG